MKAEILCNKNYPVAEIDPKLYGSFVEHLGRAVYGGVYQPDHPTADDMGFRKDVLDMVKQLEVPIIRYPGGNFVSGYKWEDGIGDRSKRPQRMELAWQTIETNQVGIDEFQEWCKRAGSELMMTVNLGTRGPEEAKDLLEYCNSTTDTYYANLRRQNGHEEPFNIKTWCLGNEMDGPWQICHKTAEEYGRTASETAKLMKLIDPDIKMVVCGSSNSDMPTFIEWEQTVLQHTYELVDYISLHNYYGNPNNDTADYLSRSITMDGFIKTVAAICDTVKTQKHSDHQVDLSFDEWNVWFHSNDADAAMEHWQIAPPQLEDIYTFEDALMVGCLLSTLQNNCDRVRMACLAQLVNVIAPIMTNNNGGAWAQTIFYPFMYGSVYGRGTALKPVVKCDTYDCPSHNGVPYVSTSVIDNHEKRELVVFAVNRSLDDSVELTFNAEDYGDVKLVEHKELYSDDLKAVNTENNAAVTPADGDMSDCPVLKKHSWNMLRYSY